MKEIHFVTILLLYSGLLQIKCRKYDIDAEAMKLYGENLDTVVQRFRKTPDYMKILNEKIKESKKTMEAIISQAKSNFKQKLIEAVKESLPEPNIPDVTPTLTKNERLRILRHNIKKNLNSARYNIVRDNIPQDVIEETTKSPVEMLDDLVSESKLTVAEKNHYMDLAFQYVGDAIHAIIKGSGSDYDETIQSTRYTLLIESGKRSTTEHPIVHAVTVSSSERTKHPELRSTGNQTKHGLRRLLPIHFEDFLQGVK